jgi:membrane protein implicated in regulation of membrane protease activity
MRPSGAHTHPEIGGSGGNGWLVILGAIVLVTIAGPVAHAVSDLIRVLAIAVVVVLAIAGLAAVLTYRVRHSDTNALTQRGMRALQGREPRALTQALEVHLHFHGVSAKDVAAIIAPQDEAR